MKKEAYDSNLYYTCSHNSRRYIAGESVTEKEIINVTVAHITYFLTRASCFDFTSKPSKNSIKINMRIRKYEALVTKCISKCMFDYFIYLFLGSHQNRMNNISIILIVAPYTWSNYSISIKTDAHT